MFLRKEGADNENLKTHNNEGPLNMHKISEWAHLKAVLGRFGEFLNSDSAF